MRLALCCGGGICCALVSVVLWLGGGLVGQAVAQESDSAAAPPSCSSAGVPAGNDAALTDVEQKVVTYLADMIESGKTPMISEEKLEQELGLSSAEIERLVESKLRPAVMTELERRGFDLASLGGNCSKYSACSVDQNLMNASGKELERYEAEVALDGTSFTDRLAPDFSLPSTTGDQVSLSDYRGKNVALVFLSAHCYHSLDTLPILAELKQEYKDAGLEILPLFINSGSAEDVAAHARELDIRYPLVVSEGKEISEAYESRMVPSTFLIDEQGRLTKKLVGFKDKATLNRAFEELVGS